MLKTKKSALSILVLALFGGLAAGCGGTSTGNPEVAVEDTSASGAVAGAVGGALSNSSSSGTLSSSMRKSPSRFARWSPISEAWASTACPTFHTAQGDGCLASGSSMWLTYSGCDFKGGATSWTGVESLTRSSGSPSCGSFPGPVDSGTLTLQYVTASSSTTPSSAFATNKFGTVGEIDDHSANLKNYDGAVISTIENAGYGSQVSFDSTGARDSLTIAHRIAATLAFDHSLIGTVAISETAGATQRTVSSGYIDVYHNFLHVIGRSTFTSVVHQDGCCFPVSGKIQTVFRAGSTTPTQEGLKAVGATETLTFTGCGTATLQSYDGTTSSVLLTRCY